MRQGISLQVFFRLSIICIALGCQDEFSGTNTNPEPNPTNSVEKIKNGSGKTTNDLTFYKKYYGGRILSDSILKSYADTKNIISQKGLILWYPCSAESTAELPDGNKITTDSSRNRYDYVGLFNGNIEFIADRYNKPNAAYNFSNSGHITINSSGNNFIDTLGNATNEATISVWIYLTLGSVGGAIIDNNRDAIESSGYTLIFDNDFSPSRLDPDFQKRVFPAGFYAQVGTSADTAHNTITKKYGEILFDIIGNDTTYWNKQYSIDSTGQTVASLTRLNYTPTRTPFNKWLHLVFTYNHGVGTLYLNGKIYTQKNGMNPISQNQDQLYIGAPVWEQSITFQGAMDDIAMWNRVLNLDEILKLSKY